MKTHNEFKNSTVETPPTVAELDAKLLADNLNKIIRDGRLMKYFYCKDFPMYRIVARNEDKKKDTLESRIAALHKLMQKPLNKIAISRAFHELWKLNDIQSEESDCNQLLKITSPNGQLLNLPR
ncbi:6701_t:CDS:2 [Paraglomus occultum]|uniref:6701_t:CDS:1 n=1 Tax=Paraglomus occultum TaxID=144539 RepID=A0A9N9BI35_9GLOM|nr:6701_t:CDS:2 [Paraglomus occultum]